MSSLADACRDGTVTREKISSILDQIEADEHNPYGAIDDQDKFGESALRWAATHGRKDLVKLLIKRRANINVLNDLQQTPLHAACWNQQTEICSILLSAGATVNFKDRDGCTSLHKAAWKGYKEIVLLLIQASATIDVEDSNGATPLHYASVQGHDNLVEVLLSKNANPLHRDKKGISPVQRATTSGRLEVVKLLLNKNANIEDVDGQGLSLLHRVAVKGYYNITEELLRRGANYQAKDKNGATPLHKAAASGNLQIMKLLLRNNANIESDDVNGATCIHKAAWAGEVQVLTWLLENGGNIEHKDKKLVTPLHYACWNNKREAVKFLCDHGANVNNTDWRGNTPLIDACGRGNVDAIELLIFHKANILAKNKSESTPFFEAIRMQQKEVVRFLLHRFGLEGLGGPEVWQNALKLAKSTKNEAIFQLIVRANSTEIMRANIYKNLKIIYQQYEMLRERLGKAEYLCTLLDRHGHYAKNPKVQPLLESTEKLLHKLFDGIEDPAECSVELLCESKDYKQAQTQLQQLLEVFEREMTLGSPFPDEEEDCLDVLEKSKVHLDISDTNSSVSETTSTTEESIAETDFDSADDSREKKDVQAAKKREKLLQRFKKKESLHSEIEKNIEELLTKLLQNYPSVESVPDLPNALELFNNWKAKVTVEVVEAVKKIDMLARQLHDALIVGYKLMAEQRSEGKQIISQLVHAAVEDKKKQSSTSEKVEEFRAYKSHLRILLERAEEQEEKLLQIELEERRRRDAESRLEQEKQLMASPRKHMTEEEALRIAEMEVEKYKRKQEYTPEELQRLELLKEKAKLQKQQEDRDAESLLRVEFPDEVLPKVQRSIPSINEEPESPFDPNIMKSKNTKSETKQEKSE